MQARLVSVSILMGFFLLAATPAGADWPRWGRDPGQTASAPAEEFDGSRPATLTWSKPLDGRVSSRPVIADGRVFVGTEAGTVYALAQTNGGILWSHPGLGRIQNACTDVPGGYGVTGSPAYDPAAGVVAVGGDGHMVALDPATGAALPGWPVDLGVNTDFEHVWGAVTVAFGYAYVGVASYCDTDPYTGRVVAVSLADHTVRTWIAVPNGPGGGEAGIWSAGGISVDPVAGVLYVATGNAANMPQWSDSVVRLGPDLDFRGGWQVPDQDTDDNDLGSTSPLVIPDLPGPHPHLLAVSGKAGLLHVLDRDALVEVARADLAGVSIGGLAWADEGPAGRFLIVPSETALQAFRLDVTDAGVTLTLAWQLPGYVFVTAPAVAGPDVLATMGAKLVRIDVAAGPALSDTIGLPGLSFGGASVADGRAFVGWWTKTGNEPLGGVSAYSASSAPALNGDASGPGVRGSSRRGPVALAEGTTRPGFATFVTLASNSDAVVHAVVSFLCDGPVAPPPISLSVPPHGRATVNLNDAVGSGADFGVSVTADGDLVVERPEFIAGPAGRVAHVEGATGGLAQRPSTEWHFAEGTTRDGFQEYLTVANPGTDTANVRVSWGLLQETLRVSGGRRATIDINALVGGAADLGLEVSSSSPIVAERVIYFDASLPGVGPVKGAQASTGASTMSSTLFFAEGTTRPGFDTFLTLGNPGPATTATVTPLASGTSPMSIDLPPGRTTLYLSGLLPPADFGFIVSAGQPISAERVIYVNVAIPGTGVVVNATVSPGSSAPAGRWEFAEGTSRPGFASYLLVSNPGDRAVRASVSLNGGVAMTTVDVGAGGRATVDLRALANQSFDFGISVSADGPVVAERAVYVRGTVGTLVVGGANVVVGATR